MIRTQFKHTGLSQFKFTVISFVVMDQEALLPTQATTNKKNIKKRQKCSKCEYTTCSVKKMGRHVAQEYDLVLEEGKWTMRKFTRTGAWVEQQRKLTEKGEMGGSSGNSQALEAAKSRGWDELV